MAGVRVGVAPGGAGGPAGGAAPGVAAELGVGVAHRSGAGRRFAAVHRPAANGRRATPTGRGPGALVAPLAGRGPAAAPAVVVDLCCGSGAVGAALVAALGPDTELYAADVDPAAVRCARRNVAAVGGRVYAGDLFAPLPAALRGRIDVLAANVPYVPSDAIALLPPEARDHEPLVALDGGTDGLDVLRRVAAAAREWLAPGGCVLVETSERQAARAALAFLRGGLAARLTCSDELDVTVVIGTPRAG
ncbi:putative protein N(5)-glutamine methyltransferase [Streptomyces sp. NPDC057702]|uniref:putative protein N(5)-glutamine methyltransferase n=1 Tax=unclassified Streptomyces TaxID=2593676 RepID=UPI00369CB8FF